MSLVVPKSPVYGGQSQGGGYSWVLGTLAKQFIYIQHIVMIRTYLLCYQYFVLRIPRIPCVPSRVGPSFAGVFSQAWVHLRVYPRRPSHQNVLHRTKNRGYSARYAVYLNRRHISTDVIHFANPNTIRRPYSPTIMIMRPGPQRP
jgi:hypothetical protein